LLESILSKLEQVYRWVFE